MNTTSTARKRAQDSLPAHAAIGGLPNLAALISVRSLRKVIEDQIEAYIGLLDDLDGDIDFEPWDEREAVCEDEGAQCDGEGVSA